jgi:hypothetical protein
MQCKAQGAPLYRFAGQAAAGKLTYGVLRCVADNVIFDI